MMDDYYDLLEKLASIRKLRIKVINEINSRLKGVNSMDILVINAIRKGKGEYTMSDLSEITGFSNATITSAVDSLEQRGLAERTKGRDRRRYIITLTKKGAQKAAEIDKLKREIFADFLNKMTKEDLSKLSETLAKFNEIMDKYV
ncbi:MAG: MarR family transcriptional regulator [Thermoplasmatales archaeon]